MSTLANKVALVTGAGRGLGRACAQIFAREGAKVVVATKTRDNGEETVRLIRDAGGEAVFVRTDVARTQDVQATVRAAVDNFGGLDFAVNNAIHSIGARPFADIDDDDWQEVAEAAVWLCTDAASYVLGHTLLADGGAVLG